MHDSICVKDLVEQIHFGLNKFLASLPEIDLVFLVAMLNIWLNTYILVLTNNR